MGTYIPLAKTVLTGTQATITFSSIPQTYTDLLIVASARTNNATGYGQEIAIRPNASTSTIYSWTYLTGTGTTASSSRTASGSATFARLGYINTNGSTASTFGSTEIYIPNYTGTTQKAISTTSANENNNATSYVLTGNATLVNLTSAITSIDLVLTDANSFDTGSRFDLYGIA